MARLEDVLYTGRLHWTGHCATTYVMHEAGVFTAAGKGIWMLHDVYFWI